MQRRRLEGMSSGQETVLSSNDEPGSAPCSESQAQRATAPARPHQFSTGASMLRCLHDLQVRIDGSEVKAGAFSLCVVPQQEHRNFELCLRAVGLTLSSQAVARHSRYCKSQ